MLNITKDTIQKFDVPGPRYTSYPTAPNWSEDVGADTYRNKLTQLGQTDKTVSLYIHIPFCQSLCSFCACNVVIRPSETKYGDQYLDYLFKEIDLVRKALGKNMKVTQFHWGGGTPTYLNNSQIDQLFQKISQAFDIDFEGEIAIEIDPRTIDPEKVIQLREIGFNRVSMGVQDFNLDVQKAVNRVQSFESVEKFYQQCRDLKFKSVNFDLIYGLPKQTSQTFSDTVNKVIGLRPDRIALYSFAYVPWLKRHQQKISEDTLPSNDTKLDIFLNSRKQFLDSDYQAIAMDHFALKNDEMALAFNEGRLYRNFMGYTVKPADEYIGMGLTSIGFLEHSFIQNFKALPEYYKTLDSGKLPVDRGKVLNQDDIIRQWTINSLMCQFSLDKEKFENQFNAHFDDYFAKEAIHMQKCVTDGLVVNSKNQFEITELGKIFIRNVCMGFDFYLKEQLPKSQKFSRTI